MTVGPYELQDFTLYYVLRFGYAPAKVAFLAHAAWGGQHDLARIKTWLRVFVDRFFKLSQFKRSALPNAPKVGSGGSLSPRGDYRAPSDAEAAAWVDLVPDAADAHPSPAGARTGDAASGAVVSEAPGQ